MGCKQRVEFSNFDGIKVSEVLFRHCKGYHDLVLEVTGIVGRPGRQKFEVKSCGDVVLVTKSLQEAVDKCNQIINS